MRWRRILLVGAVIVVLPFLIVGFVLPFDGAPQGQWGPFRGQIIDAETGKPIPGGIFVAIWIRSIPTPAHNAEIFNDARVTVADAEGRFEISRRWRPIFSGFIEPVYLVCVAPGYASFRCASTNQPAVIRLRPLSREDPRRSDSGDALLGLIPNARRKHLESSINFRRQQLALQPIHFGAGRLERSRP